MLYLVQFHVRPTRPDVFWNVCNRVDAQIVLNALLLNSVCDCCFKLHIHKCLHFTIFYRLRILPFKKTCTTWTVKKGGKLLKVESHNQFDSRNSLCYSFWEKSGECLRAMASKCATGVSNFAWSYQIERTILPVRTVSIKGWFHYLDRMWEWKRWS